MDSEKQKEQEDQYLYKYIIVGNPRSKKNSMRPSYHNGKFKLLQSQSYIDYAIAAKPQLIDQMRKNKQTEPIDYPINLKCLYYRSDKRRVDLVNLLNGMDILTEVGIIADDNYKIVASVDGSRILYDKDNPRTEIYISLSNG